MKNNFLKIFLSLTFALLLLGACKDEYDDTKQAGQDFLAANKLNPGVIETASGLQYFVYNDNPYGFYPRATTTQFTMNLHGYFIDGTEFDSYDNKIITYQSLPTGLKEVVRRIRIGSKWRVWIPSSLAYGSDGLTNDNGGYKVDPNSVLIYDIEILSEN